MSAVYVFLLAFVLWQKVAPPGPGKIDWSAFTARRALGFAGLSLLLLILPQLIAVGFELPFLLSLDITFLADLTALLIIVGVQAYIRPIASAARNTLSALHVVRRNVMRAVKRALRSRPQRTSAPPPEEPDGNWVFA